MAGVPDIISTKCMVIIPNCCRRNPREKAMVAFSRSTIENRQWHPPPALPKSRMTDQSCLMTNKMPVMQLLANRRRLNLI
eukprot:scaffold9446_cov85-Cylindrotheca_fusiformis.AAC.2